MASWTRIAALVVLAAAAACGRAGQSNVDVPAAQVGAAQTTTPGEAVAVVAGGCFWGVEAVYRHTRGVTRAVSGYAGGTAETAQYDVVSSGTTDHAEAVEVTFDPSVISYDQILRIFFSVAHDPTELNRQGPDVGRQYRSAIFTVDAEQDRIAREYVSQLDRAKTFAQPVVTEISKLPRFYAAEAYHQNYAALHPDDMYIRINDAPKIERLRASFPDWFVADKRQ